MSGEQTAAGKKLTAYTLCCLFGIAVGVGVCWIGRFAELTDQDKLRVMCDAFTVPGLLLMGIGALMVAANHGAFYGLGYGLRTAKEVLLPFLPHEYVRYRDYIEQKKKKKKTGYRYMLITGAVFLAVGIALLILFNVKYPEA